MEVSSIKDYHIHVYYDEKSIDLAKVIAKKASELFNLSLGHFHEREVGPHPRWSVQLSIPLDKLSEAVSWFSLNRSGLTVFIHPNTGKDLEDHRDHAFWMGELLDLNLKIFL